MRNLRLAIVTPFPPSKGTLNEYAYHLVSNFKQKEEIQELIIITDRLPEGESYEKGPDDMKITFEACWSFNELSTPISILKAVKKHQPDMVLFNIHFLSFGDRKVPAAFGLMTPLLCRLTGTPSVSLLHNIVESVDLDTAGISGNRVMKFIYNLIGTLLTTILLGSNMVAVTIARYVRILENKYSIGHVALIPHGSFEVPEFPDFELPEGPKRIMAFGKFGTYKKVESMIEAAKIITARTGEHIQVVIAGTDSPNAPGYLESVREKYADMENLEFTGYVEEEDVEGIFKDSAVAVFPYTGTTGSSGVLHQAGSYGNACVLPNIGDLKDLIEEEGYRGRYFEPGDAASMADAIQPVLFDDDLRKELGQANYEAAVSLSMSDITDWYLLHFNNILNPSVKPVRQSGIDEGVIQRTLVPATA